MTARYLVTKILVERYLALGWHDSLHPLDLHILSAGPPWHHVSSSSRSCVLRSPAQGECQNVLDISTEATESILAVYRNSNCRIGVYHLARYLLSKPIMS